MLSTPARAITLVFIALQSMQSPAQLLDQVDALLKQLRGQLTAPSTPAATVTDAAGLTKALAAGGPIALAAGTYVGNFVISKPTVLTGAGAVLAPADPLTPPLVVQSDDVIVSDLTVRNGAPDRETVVVGSLTATSAAANPHRVRFLRVTVTAGAAGGHRGFSLHGSDITLDTVTVTGFTEKGRDSQAVWICNGPGPYTITNSVLEASGENLLVGGADPGIVGMNPADITITGTTLRKPDTWRSGIATVKNSFELKTGVRVRFENNTIDGWWRDGQDAPIQLTVRNQDGKCTWCLVDDVTLRGNVVRNASAGSFSINILGFDDGYPSAQVQTIVIDRNLFVDAVGGIQIGNGVAKALTVTNNTWPAITSKFLSFWNDRPRVMTPLTFRNNVLRSGIYGVSGDGTLGMGLPSLTQYATLVDFTGNVIEAAPQPVKLPAGNTIVPAGGLAGLLDPTTFKLLNGTAGY